ncbi:MULTISPECIES: TraI domain-containing protein [Thioalkalivibrio]|uniref:TraI domain-containing protein n=1 Tax=Thioalkalivibrio TaxID=106633 RepID=UPI00037210ED|nr:MULTISPECIES: TraI domain-containing protein [Thioalkalivibrio]
MKANDVQELQRLVGMDDIARHEPVIFAARVEIQCEGRAPSGEPYYRLRIYDSTGYFTAFARIRDWEGHPLGGGQFRSLALHTIETERGHRHVVAYPEVGSALPDKGPLDLLPVHHAPESGSLQRLVNVVENLSIESYREFVREALSDQEFAIQYLTLPASKRCHHAKTGGLIAHSLELAEAVNAVGRAMALPTLQTEAGILLALMHDIGKIVLASEVAERVPTRSHEELIEYALQEPLLSSKQMDADAYHTLWALIVAYRNGDSYSAPMATVVRGLDGCSAQTDATVHGSSQARVHRYWQSPCGGRKVWVPPLFNHDTRRRAESR